MNGARTAGRRRGKMLAATMSFIALPYSTTMASTR
jgi:hypothetical protein